MVKINKHIEIVRSSTTRLSSMGQKSCDMLLSVLGEHYQSVGVSVINDIYDLENLVAKQPDLVFLGVKMIPAPDDPASKLWLSAYLDANGINYTGSPAAAIALDFNKPIAKKVVKAAGLNTSTHFMAHPSEYHTARDLPLSFPLFVKPPNGGGGKGIGADSVVRNFTEFAQKVAAIDRDFQSDALVESYLPGREFSVAILETIDSDELIAMPIELIAEQNSQGDRILGQKIKAADTELVMAVLSQTVKDSVVELATAVFRALGARDYGRIDIRLDSQGTPYFLEANLIPGLAFHDFVSYFTSACWINQGMDHEAMLLSIVELGLARANVVEDNLAVPTTESVIASGSESVFGIA
jgi:D-alanine-D-alanine ligase